ncbi:Lrp/AsnC family transcriptional regulator [Sneathiella sp. HT1-7]|jgi:Lrp/AsnC family leucine-responsive transcriptional regulator|uniref:Lrp/AsnC family transcriptional regulator n=1 Tax=Sneathiella sp. HT1-7 TaxID=2887192 RepID=UPI001D15091E|nr:Lrp/AsnC family transcriptional regulator [Sneathiella sp. HT1-7]MCC3305185.1 Lrp/AsnC family transcriptional regulator [Sneathiella sp. HT1-7]
MTLVFENGIDGTDRLILKNLQSDGRLSMSDLAKAVGMSAPSVKDRVRRLEDRGVIRKFTIDIDMKALGYELEAIVRIKPRPGSLHLVERMILDEARFTNCDKVTGDDCFIVRLALKSVQELDSLLDPFHEKAETNTSIVKSSPIRNRTPVSQ